METEIWNTFLSTKIPNQFIQSTEIKYILCSTQFSKEDVMKVSENLLRKLQAILQYKTTTYIKQTKYRRATT